MKASKNKSLDAVAMMREIRDKLSKQYITDPEEEHTNLKKIREKYKIKVKEKV